MDQPEPTKYRVQAVVLIDVFVNDPTVIDRVVENHNDEGVPVEFGKGLDGWRDTLYNLNEDEVVQMLAYNLALFHRFLHELDGWADLEPAKDDDGKYIIPEDDWKPRQAATAEIVQVVEWEMIEKED